MADYYKRISNELNIVKGRTESELNYKYRIIYSAVGRMAYASLWDTLEDYDLVVDKVMEWLTDRARDGFIREQALKILKKE